MLEVVRGDKTLVKWVGDQLRMEFEKCIAQGVISDGWLIAGVVYHGYREHDCELSIASTNVRWATKKVLKQLLGMPFYELGCIRITATTDADNNEVRNFLTRLGFKHEGTLRCASPTGSGKDAVIYGLLKSEFQEGKYGKENTKTTESC